MELQFPFHNAIQAIVDMLPQFCCQFYKYSGMYSDPCKWKHVVMLLSWSSSHKQNSEHWKSFYFHLFSSSQELNFNSLSWMTLMMKSSSGFCTVSLSLQQHNKRNREHIFWDKIDLYKKAKQRADTKRLCGVQHNSDLEWHPWYEHVNCPESLRWADIETEWMDGWCLELAEVQRHQPSQENSMTCYDNEQTRRCKHADCKGSYY